MRKKPGTTQRRGAEATRHAEGNLSKANPEADQKLADVTPSKTIAAGGPKSLMKTSELGAGRTAQRRPGIQPAHIPSSVGIRRKTVPTNISGSRQQKIEERIAAATEQLSAGITEAASAAEELRRSM